MLDRGFDNIKDVRAQGLDSDEHVREVVRRNWKGGDQGRHIYEYNVSDGPVFLLIIDREGVGRS